MKETKIVQILSTLTHDELKEFGRFVESPYFNRLKDVIRLYTILKKYHPDFDNKNFTIEKIFYKLFPGQKYHYGNIRNLISDLGSLAEQYLAAREIKEMYIYHDFLTLRALSERDLGKLFIKKYSEVSGKLNKQPEFSMNRFFSKYLINGVYKEHSAKTGLYSSYLDEQEQPVNNLSMLLTASTVFDHRKNMTRKTINRKAGQNNMPEAWLNSFQFDKFSAIVKNKWSPFFRFLGSLVMLMNNTDFDNNLKFSRDFLLNTKDNLEREDLIQYYDILLSSVISKIKEGNTEYRSEKFGIYKEMISLGCLGILHRGKERIHPIRFIDIVNSAANLNEIKWAYVFIDNNISFVVTEFRKEVRSYCEAKLLFKQNKFEDCIKHLGARDYNIPQINFSARELQLLAFFELGYFEEAVSTVKSFSIFVKRNKSFAEDYKLWVNNFIKMYSLILEVHFKDKKKKSLIDLKNMIEECKMVNHKSWLLDKVSSLQT